MPEFDTESYNLLMLAKQLITQSYDVQKGARLQIAIREALEEAVRNEVAELKKQNAQLLKIVRGIHAKWEAREAAGEWSNALREACEEADRLEAIEAARIQETT